MNKENIDNIKLIDEYIEKKIETKISNLLTTLPKKLPEDYNTKHIQDFTLIELYKNTLQTVIDILNDVIELFANRKNIGETAFRRNIIECFLKENRKVYVGIVFIFLSFILYFIEDVSI